MIDHHAEKKASFRVNGAARRSDIFSAMLSVGVKKSRITIHTYSDGTVGVEARALGPVDIVRCAAALRALTESRR